MSGLPGCKIAELIEYRENMGIERGESSERPDGRVFKVEEWIVEWNERQRGRDLVLDELVDRGWVGKSGKTVKVGWCEGEDDVEEEDVSDDSEEATEEELELEDSELDEEDDT